MICDNDIFVNCNWAATRWQQCSIHLHTNNTENNTIGKNNTQNKIPGVPIKMSLLYRLFRLKCRCYTGCSDLNAAAIPGVLIKMLLLYRVFRLKYCCYIGCSDKNAAPKPGVPINMSMNCSINTEQLPNMLHQKERIYIVLFILWQTSYMRTIFYYTIFTLIISFYRLITEGTETCGYLLLDSGCNNHTHLFEC